MKKTNITKYLGSYSAGTGGSGGGKGAVESVNGKVGVVNLTGEDINTTVDTSSLTVAEDIKNLKSTKFDASNLVGGNSISITPLSPVGGIDDYTTLLLHFDNSLSDSSSKNVQYTTSGTPLYREIHTNFGTAVNISGGNVKYTSPDAFNFETKDWTVDFWSYLTSLEDTWGELYFTKDGTTSTKVKIENGVMSFFLTSDPVPTFTYTISSANAFNHFAFQRSGEYVYWYLNGKLMGNHQYVSSMPLADSLNIYDGSTNDNKVFFDELRVSNGKAEFDIDGFTPNEYPYTTSDGESGIHVINFTGSTLPDNVYKTDNLLPGKNIEFEKTVTSGGIDEYTVALWNFDSQVDGKFVDEISGLAYTGGTLNTTYKKFGDGSAYTTSKRSLLSNDYQECTVDFWYMKGSNFECSLNGTITTIGESQISGGYKLTLLPSTNRISVGHFTYSGSVWKDRTYADYTFNPDTFYHIVLQQRSSDSLQVYINGKLIMEKTLDASLSRGLNICIGGNGYFDELRVSNIARYPGQSFEVPFEAYSRTEAIVRYKVNNTLDSFSSSDTASIVKSSDGTNQVSVTGVNTKSGTVKYDWEGTQDQYQKLVSEGSINEDWYYHITDDVAVGTPLNIIKTVLVTEDEYNALTNPQANIMYAIKAEE